MENKLLSLFGFKLRKKDEEVEPIKTFAPPAEDDGAVTISSSSFFGATAMDVEGIARNEIELITRYREMSMQPEIESAIEDIVNEAIVADDDGVVVKAVLDELKESDKIKKAIYEEFDNIKKLINFKRLASDIFRRYYVDGRLFYHVIVDVTNPQMGIKELRYIDPRKIKKVKQVLKKRDEKSGIEIIDKVEEYYLYNDKMQQGNSQTGLKIAIDSILYVNSGLLDPKRNMVLSYIHKAIKALNQLRMIEDASVVYKISRSPQRRVFYIDVGNLPKIKAEQHMRDMMTKYRNKVTYDATTGEITDSRKFLNILEDYWIARKSDGKATEVTTLQSTDNFNDMEMVEYFKKNLYRALNVPVTRLDPSQAVSIGRSMEITRDELKFSKFIDKLRNRFVEVFYQALRVQLVLKGICSLEEWERIKEDIYFDFTIDNNFVELKESELMTERLNILSVIDPFTSKYYSKQWIQQNILRLNDEEIAEMEQQIAKEKEKDMITASEDQKRQIDLQAQAMMLQQQAGLLPDQQIDAGQEPNPNPATNPKQPTNPYNL